MNVHLKSVLLDPGNLQSPTEGTAFRATSLIKTIPCSRVIFLLTPRFLGTIPIVDVSMQKKSRVCDFRLVYACSSGL